MKIIKMLTPLILIFGMMLMFGCDSGLEYIGMEITTYPEKIVYVKDVDTQISVKGLVITLTSRDGRIDVSKEPDDYTTNTDFSREGIYEVTYKLDNNVSVSFPVQVVTKEWMQQYLASDV